MSVALGRFVPRGLKNLAPGYRARWRHRYGALLAGLAELAPRLQTGEDAGVPWIEVDGLRFHGFWTEGKDAALYDDLAPDLPRRIAKPHFRLARDWLTRHRHPHMLPTLAVEGFAAERMTGFHGSHKDALAQVPDPAARTRLAAAFAPRPDEVVVDCGAYLGFGELRLSPLLPRGRIFAIEAASHCAALLRRNVEANRIGNVSVLHRAVWKDVGRMTLHTGAAQANSLVEDIALKDGFETVETIGVDALAEAEKLERLDFLCLTLNGAEVEALEGAANSLRRFRPRVRLAGWYERDGRPIHALTKPLLEAAGYEVFVGPRGNVFALPGPRPSTGPG